MLTLRELRNMVEVAEVEGRVPSVKALLEADIPIAVKEIVGEQTEIVVYRNGFVFYRVGNRATVFPLHPCREYIYESSLYRLSYNINLTCTKEISLALIIRISFNWFPVSSNCNRFSM